MMPRKVTARDVQQARGEWWSFHYENRQKVKAMGAEQLHMLQYVCALVSPPVMTVFGSADFDRIDQNVYVLAGQYGVDPLLVNQWYVSDMGWNSFLEEWSKLPEPVDLYTSPCVQVGELYTLSTAQEILRP